MLAHHRLSPAQFDKLAAGMGGPDAVAALRAGQTSKHMVMLLTIMELVRTDTPDNWAELNQAYEVLLAAQRSAPDSVNTLLGHPQVGLWAARCLRRLRGTGAEACPLAVELSQLAAVAAVAGLFGGCRFDLAIRLRQGTALLPSLGVAVFDVTDPWAPARLRSDGQRMTVSAGDRSIEVPADPEQDASGWLGLRKLTSRPPGAEISVELVDLGPTREGIESTHQTRLSTEAAGQWQEVFDKAWQALAHYHPARAADIRSGLVSIAVPEPDQPSLKGMSASMREGFGHFVAAFNDEPLAFAETLVHEFQHSKLTALTDLASLHDAADDLVYFAPWRQDPRHLEGLLQGTYAFVGITDYWAVMRPALEGNDRLLADFEFARWRGLVAEAIEVLLGSGRLTPVGERVVRWMRQTATAWRDVAIDTEIQQLADRTVIDTRICWLAANRHPDPATIAVLADAWQAGEPCPTDPGDIATVTATDGRARNPERYLLFKARIGDPERFADLCGPPAARTASGSNASEADVAYATDDYARAMKLTVADLADAASRPAADLVSRWAGLALALDADRPGEASRLLMRAPEVVAALYREVADRTGVPPDPVAAATWLAQERAPLPR